MGVFLDYWWKAECTEAELVERLERLRVRIQDLGVREVSQVIQPSAPLPKKPRRPRKKKPSDEGPPSR
jgi:hypothetical protein